MYRNYIKRIFDILLALILLPLVTIVILLVGLAIKLDDKGHIFYNAGRLGKNQVPFKMYKLRSMKENAPDIRNADGTTFNSDDDPRITRVGKFIRKTSLDEFPQVLNVLKGDMSFIGPRPSPFGDKSMYPEDFLIKFEVKPGITGYSQALVRNSATMDERIFLDKYYVENISLFLDLKILWITLLTVVRKKNINRN